MESEFLCQRGVLLKEIPYFKEIVLNNEENVKIIVHCDAKTFEWLLNYANKKRECQKYKISVSNVLSLLITSDFLKMDDLVF